jgi:hypothetical protein
VEWVDLSMGPKGPEALENKKISADIVISDWLTYSSSKTIKLVTENNNLEITSILSVWNILLYLAVIGGSCYFPIRPLNFLQVCIHHLEDNVIS